MSESSTDIRAEVARQSTLSSVSAHSKQLEDRAEIGKCGRKRLLIQQALQLLFSAGQYGGDNRLKDAFKKYSHRKIMSQLETSDKLQKSTEAENSYRAQDNENNTDRPCLLSPRSNNVQEKNKQNNIEKVKKRIR